MDKNVKGQIDRAAWTLMQSSRDAVLVALTQACKSKDIDVKPEQYQKLILIVTSAFEAGFSAGNRTFYRAVEKALEKAVSVSDDFDVSKTKKKSG